MKNFTLKMAFLGTILLFSLNLALMAQTGTADSVATAIGVTNTTAFTGGWVTTTEVLTERGVCYGTSDNPTIDDNKVPSWKNSPTVAYEPAYLEGLMPNTTYFIRAYATGTTGTVYSASKSFTTANNAEVLWQLAGSTGFSPAITGPLTAKDMLRDELNTSISGWDKNNGKTISVGDDYLKITQPAGAEFKIDTVYFSFNVAPMSNVNFSVKKFNMLCGGYKTGATRLVFAYSLDNFITSDSLGLATLNNKDRNQYYGTDSSVISPGSFSLDNEFADMGHQLISFDTDIDIPVGKTLSIRMWVYGKHDITVLMKDVILSGEISDATTPGTAVIDSVSTFLGITNTTAYTGSWVSDMTAGLAERGVCYSTSADPTILDSRVPAWKYSPLVAFEPAYLEGLQPNTTYNVRAYGITADGKISYSSQKSFTTTNNNAEVLWQLSNFRQLTAVKSGAVIANAMDIGDSAVITGWDKNNGKSISIGEDYMKIQPQGSLIGLDFNEDIYFGLNVYPNHSNVNLTVKQINMVVAGYKTSGATLAFAYSLDGFTTEDSLGIATLDDKVFTQSRGTVNNPVKPGSGSPNDENAEFGGQFISFNTDIDVPAGSILSIRMYVWGKNGVTLLMKDIVISGETVETTDPLSNDALLTSITLDPEAALNPAFDSNTFIYTAELPSGTTSVDPSTTSSNMFASVSGAGAVDVSAGAGVSQIVVTSEDGAATNNYIITYTVGTSSASSDATLASITLDPDASLSPAFSSDVTDYTCELPAGTSSVTVTVATGDANATVSGDGAIDVSSGSATATIVVTAEDGTTTKTYTIAFTVITGVRDLSAANISFYPNPASNFVNIEGLSSETSITIFNSVGKMVSDNIVTSQNIQLDITNYKSGMYFVRIVSDNEVYASKFIKK